MRGKPSLVLATCSDIRITPADAGKTSGVTGRSDGSEDHPRGCGENLKARSQSWSGRGSPPRMRGKPYPRSRRLLCNGITPADAGKTFGGNTPNSLCWDHPRGCGENARHRGVVCRDAGSPPRMRGKRRMPRGQSAQAGITPADAGKTRDQNRIASVRKDHPRGCGENSFEGASLQSASGSPPRMRGKLICVMPCSTVDRITPADAGKTTRTPRRDGMGRDHPRGCGENRSVV